MSIVRKIEIDGQDVLFKASAAIPRIYRLNNKIKSYNICFSINSTKDSEAS